MSILRGNALHVHVALIKAPQKRHRRSLDRPAGVMPCSTIYRLFVWRGGVGFSRKAPFHRTGDLVCNMITPHRRFRAPAPIGLDSEVSDRRKAFLSASRSPPDRIREYRAPLAQVDSFPDQHVEAPQGAKSRRISEHPLTRGHFRVHVATFMPCSCIYSVKSSAMRLVNVVHKVRCHRVTAPPRSSRSSTCISTGRFLPSVEQPGWPHTCTVTHRRLCSIQERKRGGYETD